MLLWKGKRDSVFLLIVIRVPFEAASLKGGIVTIEASVVTTLMALA